MDSSFPNNGQIFDELRGCFVAATPEEHVRQRILKKLTGELNFPRELIVVEKELKELPHFSATSFLPQRRVDILCYGKNIHSEHLLYPLLLIECKKDAIDNKAVAQLTGYNTHVKACFIALANREEEWFGYLDKKIMKYVFHSGLPSFNHLMSWLKLF